MSIADDGRTGHPDWIDVARWAGAPFVNVDQGLANTHVTGILNVARWAGLHLSFVVRSGLLRGRLTASWYADEAGTVFVGSRVWVVADGGFCFDVAPNLGPFVRFQVEVSSYATVPAVQLLVVPTNTVDRRGTGPIDGVMLYRQGQSIAGSATVTFVADFYVPGPVQLTISSATTAWVASLNTTRYDGTLLGCMMLHYAVGGEAESKTGILPPFAPVVAIRNGSGSAQLFDILLCVEW